jgi:hypothetical protein
MSEPDRWTVKEARPFCERVTHILRSRLTRAQVEEVLDSDAIQITWENSVSEEEAADLICSYFDPK